MGLDKNLLPVLIVALLTWGGVFFYMLRLEALARTLERDVKAHKGEAQDDGVIESVAAARAGKSR